MVLFAFFLHTNFRMSAHAHPGLVVVVVVGWCLCLQRHVVDRNGCHCKAGVCAYKSLKFRHLNFFSEAEHALIWWSVLSAQTTMVVMCCLLLLLFHHFACFVVVFFYFSLKTKSAFKSLVAFFHLLITDVFVHYFFRFFIKFILVFALALILRVIR